MQNDEAVILLNLQPLLNELKATPSSSERELELRLALLQRLLRGYLEMHIARDECQEQLNYQYDVVLSRLMAKRGKFLQRTFEANFIQTNVLGAIAGACYVKDSPKAGNELFIIADANALAINTVSLFCYERRPP
jgi:hypothetical protein